MEGELGALAERGRGLEQCQRRARELASAFESWVEPDDTSNVVQWFETYRTGYALSLTPLDVAETFARLMRAWPAAWVFTSATLTVAGGFEHFRRRLGLDDARELAVSSPFDYARNAG